MGDAGTGNGGADSEAAGLGAGSGEPLLLLGDANNAARPSAKATRSTRSAYHLSRHSTRKENARRFGFFPAADLRWRAHIDRYEVVISLGTAQLTDGGATTMLPDDASQPRWT
jgi:hypothetical protein